VYYYSITTATTATKALRHIFYRSQVIAHFVAMATRVSWGKTWFAAFDGPSPTPPWMQRSRRYLLQKPSYSSFCPNFQCYGNRGQLGININGMLNWPTPTTPP